MLNERELGAYLRHATRSLFRLETLPAYDVPTDRGDFPRYLSGEPAPDRERKGRWLDFLQIERITAAIGRPNVRLGVIRWRTPARVLPLHSFHLYDHRAVVVGTRSGTAIMGEREVPDYEALFDELEHLAVFGDDARVLLHRVANDYRKLESPG